MKLSISLSAPCRCCRSGDLWLLLLILGNQVWSHGLGSSGSSRLMGGNPGAHTSMTRVRPNPSRDQEDEDRCSNFVSTCRPAADCASVFALLVLGVARRGIPARPSLLPADRGWARGGGEGRGRDCRLPISLANTRAQQLGLMERYSKERVESAFEFTR